MPRLLPTSAAAALVVATGLGEDPGPGILRAAAESLQRCESLTFNAVFEGTGASRGRVIHAEGRVVLERIEGDPIGVRVWVDATVQKPTFDTISRERIAYDGDTVRAMDPATGRIYAEVAPADGGRRYLGFSTVLWRNLEYHETRPLADERAATEVIHEGRRRVGGVECDVLRVRGGDDRWLGRRWFIGVDDHLPRRVEHLGRVDEDPRASVLTITGLRTNVATGPHTFTLHPGAPLADGKGDASPRREPAATTLLGPGAAAPPWTLADANGRIRTGREFRGRVVLMDFWATWCAPCRLAMPGLQRLHERFSGDGLVVLGIATDETGDAAAHMRDHGYTYDLLLGGETIKDRFAVTALPTLYVIGPEGTILYGARGYHEGFVQKIARILETQPPPEPEP